MIRHMSANIQGMLNHYKRKKMDGLFSDENGPMSDAEARKELKEKLAKGERVIPCGDCDGFDPVHGCPGHVKINGKILTIKGGLKFRNTHMPLHSFEVVMVNNGTKKLAVNITAPSGDHWNEPDWDLEHTQWAFEKGEYFIEKEVKDE